MSATQTPGVAAPRAAVGRSWPSAGIRARGGVAPVRAASRRQRLGRPSPRVPSSRLGRHRRRLPRRRRPRERVRAARGGPHPRPRVRAQRQARALGQARARLDPVPAGILSRARARSPSSPRRRCSAALASLRRPRSASAAPRVRSPQPPPPQRRHVDDIVGANDLGILLADADGETDEEAKARAKKLAEVRRLKAERKKQLQRRKKASGGEPLRPLEPTRRGATRATSVPPRPAARARRRVRTMGSALRNALEGGEDSQGEGEGVRGGVGARTRGCRRRRSRG